MKRERQQHHQKIKRKEVMKVVNACIVSSLLVIRTILMYIIDCIV